MICSYFSCAGVTGSRLDSPSTFFFVGLSKSDMLLIEDQNTKDHTLSVQERANLGVSMFGQPLAPELRDLLTVTTVVRVRRQ